MALHPGGGMGARPIPPPPGAGPAAYDGVRGPCIWQHNQHNPCYQTHDTYGYHTHAQEYRMTEQTPSEPTATQQVFDLSNIDPESAAKIAEAVERVRPLDRDQKDNLLQILSEDYYALRDQVTKAFAQARQRTVDEVKAQFPEPETQVDRFRIEAEQFMKAQHKAWKKILKRAKKEGVVIKDHYLGGLDQHRYAPSESLTVVQNHDTTERDKAIQEARKPIDRAEKAALAEIDRIQHEANRQIRLSAVSKDAAEILGTLPKADDVIAKIDEAVTAATAELAAEPKPRRGILGRRADRDDYWDDRLRKG